MNVTRQLLDGLGDGLDLFRVEPRPSIDLRDGWMRMVCCCGGVVLAISYSTGRPVGIGCPHNHAEACPAAASTEAALAGTPWGGGPE